MKKRRRTMKKFFETAVLAVVLLVGVYNTTVEMTTFICWIFLRDTEPCKGQSYSQFRKEVKESC
jgi:hypothetical protein